MLLFKCKSYFCALIWSIIKSQMSISFDWVVVFDPFLVPIDLTFLDDVLIVACTHKVAAPEYTSQHFSSVLFLSIWEGTLVNCNAHIELWINLISFFDQFVCVYLFNLLCHFFKIIIKFRNFCFLSHVLFDSFLQYQLAFNCDPEKKRDRFVLNRGHKLIHSHLFFCTIDKSLSCRFFVFIQNG